VTTCKICGGNVEFCNCGNFVMDRKGRKIHVGDTIKSFFSSYDNIEEYLEGVVIKLYAYKNQDGVEFTLTNISHHNTDTFTVGNNYWNNGKYIEVCK
jgi:hypothetical protein